MANVMNKQQLIEMLNKITYEDDFLVTIEEIGNVFSKQYFIRIVSEEMPEREVDKITVLNTYNFK